MSHYACLIDNPELANGLSLGLQLSYAMHPVRIFVAKVTVSADAHAIPE